MAATFATFAAPRDQYADEPVCKHCKEPVINGYDGPRTGWAHCWPYEHPMYLSSGNKQCGSTPYVPPFTIEVVSRAHPVITRTAPNYQQAKALADAAMSHPVGISATVTTGGSVVYRTTQEDQ